MKKRMIACLLMVVLCVLAVSGGMAEEAAERRYAIVNRHGVVNLSTNSIYHVILSNYYDGHMFFEPETRANSMQPTDATQAIAFSYIPQPMEGMTEEEGVLATEVEMMPYVYGVVSQMKEDVITVEVSDEFGTFDADFDSEKPSDKAIFLTLTEDTYDRELCEVGSQVALVYDEETNEVCAIYYFHG